MTYDDAPLPRWVAADPVVQKYRALLGSLPWADVPERPTDRPWPGPTPAPRVSFVAAYLIKLHAGKRFIAELRTYRCEHPALVSWLGFPRAPDPTAPHRFDVAATVPKRRRRSTVLRTLPNASRQFLLTATIHHLQATLPPEQQDTFGDIIVGGTQASRAWVRENNPKPYSKDGRLDKSRQPSGDPDCKLGVKSRHHRAVSSQDSADPSTPTTEARPASQCQVGVDIFGGYASGVVATRFPMAARWCWLSAPGPSTSPTSVTSSR